MKKNLICILTAAALSVATQAAVAFTVPAQPANCPTVAAIKPIGVSENTIQLNKLWFAGRRNRNYDTADTWSFIVGNIPATGAKDAFNKAMFSLKTLTFQSGPFYEAQLNRWVCVYASVAQGYPAVAITPTIDSSGANLTALFQDKAKPQS